MTISNGFVRCGSLGVGSITFSANGTLTMVGGTNLVSYYLELAPNSGTKGTLWLTGGTLIATNYGSYIGSQGSGQLTISNGELRTSQLWLGNWYAGQGTITMAGGMITATRVVLGAMNCTGRGVITIGGGALYVTNATADAMIEVCNGTLTVSGGAVVADSLVITNSCGRFIHTGGLLSVLWTNLASGLSAVGDGIPNGWKQQYDLNPFDPNLGNADADGDGFSNRQEYLAGTSPTNPVSTLRITGAVRTNDDILVTWTSVGGRTNVVQAVSNLAAAFTKVSPNIIIPGSTETTTNYLDTGGATNTPSRFYRVRLVP